MSRPGGRRAKLPPRSAREAAAAALDAVVEQGAYSNLALHAVLDKAKLDAREAALATELVYGTIQRLNTLDAALDARLGRNARKLEPWVRNILRLGAYQLLYLDRIPPHAAVSEAVAAAKRRGHAGTAGLVNAVLRRIAADPVPPSAPFGASSAARIALEASHPEWLVREWIAAFGEEKAERIAHANNEPPKAAARVNRLRTDRETLLKMLAEEGIEAEPSALSPDGVTAPAGAGNLARTQAFQAGFLTVQDESSMLVAAFLDPKPGMRVLDCCAAPGGKATHLAELMEDRGEVVACDIHPHKQKLIESAAQRLKLSSIRTICADAARLHEIFPPASFDAILLDAPCTGFGVIRRKPDVKWRKTPQDAAAIARTQRDILAAAADLLKPGGALVYSTCTLSPAENEEQIRAFLKERTDYAPAPEFPPAIADAVVKRCALGPGLLQITPDEFGSDGFFMARLVRLSIPQSARPVLK